MSSSTPPSTGSACRVARGRATQHDDPPHARGRWRGTLERRRPVSIARPSDHARASSVLCPRFSQRTIASAYAARALRRHPARATHARAIGGPAACAERAVAGLDRPASPATDVTSGRQAPSAGFDALSSGTATRFSAGRRRRPSERSAGTPATALGPGAVPRRVIGLLTARPSSVGPAPAAERRGR